MENMYIYVLPFVGAIVILLVILCSNVPLLYTVKAGKANKCCLVRKLGGRKNPKEIEIDGRLEDVSSLDPMLVCGDSMRQYDIKDGNTILVEKMTEDEKNNISTHPILVFSISKKNGDSLREKFDSHYKLRKFLQYVNMPHLADWNQVYKNLPKNLQRTTVKEFSEICSKKAGLIRDYDPSERYVLSETYLCETRKNDYSFHPVSTIYAKVCYHV